MSSLYLSQAESRASKVLKHIQFIQSKKPSV